MKIASVEVIPVRLPHYKAASDSLGTYSFSNHGIVIIRTESGLYGAGEIALAWFGGAHSICREVNEFWAAQLIGQEVTDIAAISKKLDELSDFSKRHLLAKAGIEMALYDLIGKMTQLPVYQLLGGKSRTRISITGAIHIDSLEMMVETAKQRVSEGFKELKIKVGLDDEKDLKAIRQIRNAIPDPVLLRVDANMAWRTKKQAKKLIDEMFAFGVHIVEQPLRDDCLEELSWLRDNTEALILLDESVWDIWDAKRCLEKGAADLLHVYVSEAGGLNGARKIFELAELYNTDCTLGSMPEARIGSSASAQLGIAMGNLSAFASDVRGFTAYREDVVHEELIIADGYLTIPDTPGLGVTIDFEKLKKLAVL